MSGSYNPLGDFGIVLLILLLIVSLVAGFGVSYFLAWLWGIPVWSLKFLALLIVVEFGVVIYSKWGVGE